MISVNNGLPEIAENEDNYEPTEDQGTVALGTLEKIQKGFQSKSSLMETSNREREARME